LSYPDPNAASKDRIARNEAIFRAVNERVAEIQDTASRHTDFLCECGNLDCTEIISLADEEYREVRASATTFAVVPGHVLPDVETVIEKNDRFYVVQKHREEAAIAEATDPSG
jgi:hypothetical protein